MSDVAEYRHQAEKCRLMAAQAVNPVEKVALLQMAAEWLQLAQAAPSMVPEDQDQGVYLVLDDFGEIGRSWRETDEDATDLETVITDLLDGQYNDPVRIVGFNTAEGWARDVSEDIADEIRRRCDLRMAEVPAQLKTFIDRHCNREQTGKVLGQRPSDEKSVK